MIRRLIILLLIVGCGNPNLIWNLTPEERAERNRKFLSEINKIEELRRFNSLPRGEQMLIEEKRFKDKYLNQHHSIIIKEFGAYDRLANDGLGGTILIWNKYTEQRSTTSSNMDGGNISTRIQPAASEILQVFCHNNGYIYNLTYKLEIH